jgi:hypothetical protein
MLRHACGYKLANDGHDTRAIQAYLGHRNIQNTTRYTALAPQRFKEFFRDSANSKSLIGVLLILVAGVTLPGATADAEECLAAPNSPASLRFL